MNVQGFAPQFRTTDLNRAIDFYTEKLNFTVSFRYEDFYAGVENGGHQIHLKLIGDPDPGIEFVREGKHLHFYLTVDDIQSAFADLKKAGVKIVENISQRPWGMSEFVIEDPDGHTIYIAHSS